MSRNPRLTLKDGLTDLYTMKRHIDGDMKMCGQRSGSNKDGKVIARKTVAEVCHKRNVATSCRPGAYALDLPAIWKRAATLYRRDMSVTAGRSRLGQ